MKEFSFTLSKSLAAGLRRSYRNPRNGVGLTELLNAEVCEGGLGPIEGVTNPIPIETLGAYSIEVNWPNPRLFRGNTFTLLADENRLFSVDESDWSLAEITPYHYEAVGTAMSIPSGGSWQILDAHNMWMLFNGSCTIFRSALGRVGGRPTEEVYIQSDVHIETGCLYKGRGMLAGFDRDNFWNPAWLAFWEEQLGQKNFGLSRDMPFEDNFVWWSTIGGGDMFWMFYPNLYIGGVLGMQTGHTQDKPLILDLIQRNECGFAPATYRGRVRVLLPIGEGVLAYGDGGVTYMQAVGDPTPTMARRHVSSVGIASGVAASGDLRQHVYVDNSGCVWHINSDLNVTRLGYEEYIGPMIGSDIIVSYSENKRRFTIGNNESTYVLTEYGLSKIDQRVTSIVSADGVEVGLSTDLGYDNTQVRLVTETFDMNNRALKMLRSVEISTAGEADWYVSVLYRLSKAADFIQTSWRKINKEGWAVIPCTAVEFRLAFYSPSYLTSEPPDDIVVKWQMSDKRNVRGVYAPAPNTIPSE